MSGLKICRICLETKTKMYKFDRFHLLHYYEEIMTKKIQKKDGLPQTFCYVCATMLHKYHKFKEKCQTGQKTLKEVLWQGAITYRSISDIDRTESNLKSPFSILKVSKKVKTYNIQSRINNSDDDYDTFFDNNDSDNYDSDSDYGERNKVKKVKFNYRKKIVKYEEPEIYVETLKPQIEEKPLVGVDIDVKPVLSDFEKLIDDDVDMEPSTSMFEEKKEPKVEIEVKEKETLKNKKSKSKSKAKTKTHNFKMPAKSLDSKHWKKVVLSEDEAMEQFKARASDQKYLSWPFKCLDCLKGFSKEDILKRHRLIRHADSLPLECRFCRSRFKWSNHLRKHMRQHFTKYECLRCNMVCPLESTAVFHDDYHNGVIKKCVHCELEFNHKTSYYSHLRTHRSEHLCTLCGVSFVSQVGLNRHKKIKHIDEGPKTQEDGKEDSKTGTFCDKCNICFETKQAYDVHLLHSAMHADGAGEKSKDETSVQNGLSGVNVDPTKESDAERNKLPVGPTAAFKFGKKRGTKRGIFKKPTDCAQCGKHFETQSACMRHHLAEHPRTSFYPHLERHICEYCGVSLAPGSVPQHMNMHTRKKMYPCETCGRAFYASISLKRHLLTHTGEKPFGCTLCEKKFTQSNAMQLHFRTFHLKEPYPKRNRRKKDKAEEMKTDDSDEY